MAVVVDPAAMAARASALDAGEDRGALGHGQPAGVAAPRRGRRAARWSSGAPGSPMRRQASLAAAGMAGLARIATMRSASRASPITASTSGPGSSFQGSLSSRRALVSRMRRQVASRAIDGATSAQAVGRGRAAPRRPPRPAGCRARGRARRRRTSCPPRWRPATRGCRSCWPGRRCSARATRS